MYTSEQLLIPSPSNTQEHPILDAFGRFPIELIIASNPILDGNRLSTGYILLLCNCLLTYLQLPCEGGLETIQELVGVASTKR